MQDIQLASGITSLDNGISSLSSGANNLQIIYQH
ncbi:MAG: hypothetical protein ACLRPW_07750 [Intestinibacter sp.]